MQDKTILVIGIYMYFYIKMKEKKKHKCPRTKKSTKIGESVNTCTAILLLQSSL